MFSGWFLLMVLFGIVSIPISYCVARVVSNAYFHEKFQYQIRFMNRVSCVDDQSTGKMGTAR